MKKKTFFVMGLLALLTVVLGFATCKNNASQANDPQALARRHHELSQLKLEYEAGGESGPAHIKSF